MYLLQSGAYPVCEKVFSDCLYPLRLPDRMLTASRRSRPFSEAASITLTTSIDEYTGEAQRQYERKALNVR